jgi:hypothetical protein
VMLLKVCRNQYAFTRIEVSEWLLNTNTILSTLFAKRLIR